MGKDPSTVVLVMALAFCAFCPFFARCDEIKLDIKKYNKIMSNVVAGFYKKVKFMELLDAIDEIDKAMLGYLGKAKDTLPRIRSLKSQARFSYRNCVGPVFEWCISVNSTFNICIGKIGDSNLSEMDRNLAILDLIMSAVESGLTEYGKSLECLKHFQMRMAQLDNAFQNISIYVRDDFGPGGFYGEVKAELQKRINGSSLDLSKTNKEKMEFIEHLFTVLTQNIGKATEIVKDMEGYLDEEKFYLHRLLEHIEIANDNKDMLLSDIAFMRDESIPDFKNLKDGCTKYVKWHDPFYH